MSRNNNKGFKGKGGARRSENARIYAHPLPIIFSDPAPSSRFEPGLLGLSNRTLLNPHCEGYYDRHTRSVWIVTRKDSLILWRRGFFGKGNLSRSEPSWFVRGKVTSEQIREKRRADRIKFKMDRAAAIAAVAAEAETIFETEGRVIVPALSGPAIPSGATWKPKPEEAVAEAEQSNENEGRDEREEDMEHLQLTLSEAFFLAWNFDCLTILDSDTDEPMSLGEIWDTFQRVHLAPPTPLVPSPGLRFDNPFLLHYVVYHHYRSLGWVVKTGLKFCVDYLLYKRGPVFTHAEFAIVVCPVYEDPRDQQASDSDSTFSWSWLSTINRVNAQVMKTLILAYVTIPSRERLTRLSSSSSSPTSDVDDDPTGLVCNEEPETLLNSPACLAHYSVREVIVRRFIPARMRD